MKYAFVARETVLAAKLLDRHAGRDLLFRKPMIVVNNRDLVLRPYQPLFFNRGASQ